MAKSKKIKAKQKYFTRRMKTKLVVVFIIFVLALFGLNFKLSYINMKSGDSYTIQVLAQQQYTNKTLAFKRGAILDRNSIELATSVKTYNLVLDPEVISSKEEYLATTIKALLLNFPDLTQEQLNNDIIEYEDKNYKVILKNLEYEQIEGFLTMQEEGNEDEEIDVEYIKGVWFEEQFDRKYPYSKLASDVIGFATSSDNGVIGLESYYDEYLTGTNGREFSYMDSDNQLEYVIKKAEDGNNVITTLDFNIQSIVEKYIEQYKTDYHPKNVAVVVADPNSGEILAMASDKNFDLNNPNDLTGYYTPEQISAMNADSTGKSVSDALYSIWSNYCVSATYEPGSTFKPVTVAAALEEAKTSTTQHFNCDGGQLFGSTNVTCNNKTGHGDLDVRGALMQSCNDALMQMAETMGGETFLKYQAKYGFGTLTGIDLPSEAAGQLYNLDAIKPVDLGTNSFGQNFTVNMVQMVSAFSSLINGGNYYQPHLVKQIVSSDGEVVKNIDKTLVSQTCTSETSAFIKEALLATVNEGTGKAAAVAGYQVGGKTGTAEKIPRIEGRYLLSFIGYAPYDDPKVVCYVIVDDPQVEDYSRSGYSSELFSKIMTEVLPYMNIYPE